MAVDESAVLIHGEESFLVAEAAAEILAAWQRELVSDFGHEALDAGAVTMERLRDAVLQAPFLDPHRVVTVRGLAPRRSESLAPALGELPPTTRLLITVNGRLAPGNRLLKSLTALAGGRVLELPRVRGRALRDWVFQRARRHGLSTQVAALVERSSAADLGVIDSELQKLAAYQVASGNLEADVVRELLVGGRQEEIFRLTDLMLPRPAAEAWPVLDSLLEREGATLIAYRMARYMALVLEVRSHQDRGESLAEVQASIKEHRFVVQKAYQTARLMSGDRLEAGLRALLDYEWEVKSGQIDADLGLGVTLARL